jgi:hypothetical protein
MAYEPLPLRHAERKAEARAIELAERGQSQQREDLRLQQQGRDIYALNAQLNMDRRSLAVLKQGNTDKRSKSKTKDRSQPGLRKSAAYTYHSVAARVPMESGFLRLLQT